MKKLIFAALFAIVAVGGAASVHASTWIGTTTNTSYDCDGSGQLCSLFIPAFDANVYLSTDPSQTPRPASTLPATEKRF